MGLLKKIFGICRTPKPADPGCWEYSEGKIAITLDRAQELKDKSGAIRLEGKGLPSRVLVFLGEDGDYHALKNKCSHIGGRRIDPVEGTETLQCCSVMGSIYDYNGEVISGPAKRSLTALKVEPENGKLSVFVH